jgi:DNA-binding CsgD family transcriptional regulator
MDTDPAAMTEAEFWDAATTTCTPKELQALKLNIAGMGARRIARSLGISHQAVTNRLDNAKRKVALELQRRAA